MSCMVLALVIGATFSDCLLSLVLRSQELVVVELVMTEVLLTVVWCLLLSLLRDPS